MPRHRSIRHPTAHEEKFQVPTLWLVFCHNQSCIFDAYESALTIEDLWLYLSMHEQPVPRHGKNSTQQKKERERERERDKEGKKTNIEEWPREHRSIDRKTKGDGQLVALFRRRIEPREHFYDEEDESSSADRTNASLRYRLRGPLDVTIADRTLTFRAVYEQHYGSVTALRRLVTRNFATPRDLFARRLVPAAGIRRKVNGDGIGERGFPRIYWSW